MAISGIEGFVLIAGCKTCTGSVILILYTSVKERNRLPTEKNEKARGRWYTEDENRGV